MASILVIWGFASAIGILCGGELEGEGARKGDAGDELLRGVGNNKGFREKASELKSTNASLCAEVAIVARGEAVMLATEVTPGLQQEQSPTPISLCHDLCIKGVIEWK
jgi:hypothetical protein